MKISNFAVATIISIAISGCATVQNNYVPRTEQISFPNLNQTQTVTLGEPMLRQGTATTSRGVYMPQQNNIHGYTFSQGFYPQTGEDDEYIFTSFDNRRSSSEIGYVTLGVLTGGTYPIGLRFSKTEQETCAVIPNIYGLSQAVCDTEHGFQFTERPMLSLNDFQQTLIYSGRIGDRVRISYRESSGDLARPAFANEAEYDLSTSDIIAYRGARLKVLRADNESIEYQLISNFNVAN